MENAIRLSRINTPKISDSAYEILREKIVSKDFAPGERLDLTSIEEQLGISRTPIKEALARLRQEGLVIIVPRSGTYVTAPTPREILESFQVRAILETHAIRLAATRADQADLEALDEIVRELGRLSAAEDRESIYPRYLDLDHDLHHRIVSLSGNSRLHQSHERENLHAQMARIRYRSSERELEVAQLEHERIMAALWARDVETAAAEMAAHLERAALSLLSDMEREDQRPGRPINED